MVEDQVGHSNVGPKNFVKSKVRIFCIPKFTCADKFEFHKTTLAKLVNCFDR